MANGTDAHKVFLSEITIENVHTKVTRTMFSNIDLTTKPFLFNSVFFSMTPMID